MPSLIAKTALDGLLPLSHGQMTLCDAAPGRVTSVAPLKGQKGALNAALKQAFGLSMPAPGRMQTRNGTRIIWTGPDQAFLLDADPAPLGGLAALTDQTDGWVTLRLSGPGTERALARLVPVDLRPAAFPAGSAARAPVNHMMAVIARPETGVIDVMVFRSMARTAVHELSAAMASVAARG